MFWIISTSVLIFDGRLFLKLFILFSFLSWRGSPHSDEEHKLWTKIVWVQISTPLLSTSMTLGWLLPLCLFSHVHFFFISTHLIRLWGRLNEFVFAKYLEQCLAHKCYISLCHNYHYCPCDEKVRKKRGNSQEKRRASGKCSKLV